MNRLNQHAVYLLFLLFLYTCFQAAWLLFAPQKQLLVGLNISYILVNALALLSLLYSFTQHKGHARSFLLLFSIACFSMLLGDLFFLPAILQGSIRAPFFSQVLYALFVIFLLLGFTYQERSTQRRLHYFLSLINTAIILVVLLTFDYYSNLQALFNEKYSILLEQAWLIYLIGDILLLWMVITLYLHPHRFTTRKVMALLSVALLLYIVTDFTYDYLRLMQISFPVYVLRGLYKLAILLVALAGALYEEQIPPAHRYGAKSNRLYASFAYVSILLLGMLALIQSRFSNVFLISLYITTILTLLQQRWIRQKNDALWLEMEEIHSSLEQRIAERTADLEKTKEQFRSLYENHPDTIFTFDLDGRLVSWNKKDEGFVSIVNEERELFYFHNIHEEHTAELKQAFLLAKQGISNSLELKAHHVTIGWRSLAVTLVPIIVHHNVTGIYIMTKDISVEKQQQDRIQHLAFHDPLTNLLNRLALLEKIHEAIGKAKEKQECCSLLFLDLDRFKGINDSLGHHAGDFALVEISNRLKKLMTPFISIARLGGDEFVILLEGNPSVQESRDLAHSVLAQLREPIEIGLHSIHIAVSIGIAMFPQAATDAASLLQCADIAMYASKQAGHNQICVYKEELGKDVQRRLQLEQDLAYALDRQEMLLMYQPVVDAKNHSVLGFEALIRWKHSKLGLISPAEFIPLAEATGCIITIGRWTLREACQQRRQLQALGYENMKVAVNISAKEFQQQRFASTIQTILTETGIDPRDLCIELTERIAMGQEEEVLERLKELENIGIQIAIDDFGTGYSSLSYLPRFPIHTLKIPREFIMMIGNHSEGESIVLTIISLAQALNMRIVAEGVETKEQVEFLLAHDCRYMQGYYFSRPMVGAECENWLRDFL